MEMSDTENNQAGKDEENTNHLQKELARTKIYSDKEFKTDPTKDAEGQAEGAADEWTGFRLKLFFIGLFFSVIPSSWDLFGDILLGLEYLNDNGTEKIYQTDNITNIPYHCDLLSNSTSDDIEYKCIETQKIYGILTLIITFLPGIHWYSVHITKKRELEKFFAALFFPIFMIWFKIAHLFQQGPQTAELNLLVDSCVAINEDMIQLVLQISVLFKTYETKEITTLQGLVILWSFIMASKAAAEEFIVSKLKREKKEQGVTKLFHEIELYQEIELYHEMDLKTKLLELAKQMPFYILLTTFRVLSMGLIIAVFNYLSIIIYACLFLAIIIIGYLNTWKEKEFLTRGFRSSVTTVDDRYFGEKIFQTFWFCINMILVSYIALNANYLNTITPETLSRNVSLLNPLIGVIFGTGSFSLFLFFILRHDQQEDKNLYDQETTDDIETEYLYPRFLKDMKDMKKVYCFPYHYSNLFMLIINLSNLGLTLFEYISALLLCIEYLQTANPIWGIVTAVIPFLPGIEWHSFYQELVGHKYKLTWFLSSLFFPFTVIASRVVALFAPGDSVYEPVYEINQWMNGPRMQWGRVPQLSLQLFIIFNNIEIFNKMKGGEENGLWLAYISLGFTFLSASVMDSDQTIFRKHETLRRSVDVVKIFPLSFVTIVFRIFSFSLTLSLFRYLAIPLYFLLILISILLQRWQNPASNSFIMEGTKSIFTMANKEYKDEVTFQVYWFVCNMILTLTLTFFVKMGAGFGEAINLGDLGIWNLGLYNYLEFDNRFIVQDIAAFDAIVVTICSTGLVSLGTFFIWKKLKVAENDNEEIEIDKEANKSEEGAEEFSDTQPCHIEAEPSIPLSVNEEIEIEKEASKSEEGAEEFGNMRGMEKWCYICVSNGLVLDIAYGARGTKITLYEQHGGDNQLWKFQDGFLVSKGGLVADISGVNANEAVIGQDQHQSMNQKWTKEGDCIQNQRTGMVMQVKDGKMESGTEIIMSTKNSPFFNQMFFIVPEN